MKFLTTLFLIGCVGLGHSQESMRSTGGGNGGFIEEMREASKLGIHFLSAEEIRDILYLDGKEIKEELIYPLIKSANIWNMEEDVAKIWEKMNSGEVDLTENVDYTRMEEGKCPHEEDFCTGDSPFSTIYFDVEKIAANETTLAELAGMVMHEFSHHYANYDDHPNYQLANYFKEVVAEEKVAEKMFVYEELLITEGSSAYGLLAGNAEYFCKSKGFTKYREMENVLANTLNRLSEIKVTSSYYIRSTGFGDMPWENILRTRNVGESHNPKLATKILCKN